MVDIGRCSSSKSPGPALPSVYSSASVDYRKTLAGWLGLPAGLPQSLWYAPRANRPRDAEAGSGSGSLCDRLEGDLGAMPLAAAIDRLQKEILERRVRKTFSGSANLEAKAAPNEY